MRIIWIAFAILLCFLVQSCTNALSDDVVAKSDEIERYLHVSSPAWEDQVLYFIVTDRFMDGDTTNNNQGAGEYRRGDNGFWNGGDLTGITRRLDYIKALGATGIWITPPVANQWISPQSHGTGNHGYWARNFVQVDKHYGSLDDYKELSASLHKNGMYLIQDVVVNHMGDYYTYTGPYDPEDVTRNFKLHDVPQPTQYPFDQNNALDPEQREMAIYHFTPEFQDHSDTFVKVNYQFGDLDDLNTANPVVRKALRSSYNHWIREVGVDGFRFDTPLMVEHEFWHNFLHSEDPEEPGIQRYARKLDKQQFLSFGETWIPTPPFDDHGPKEAARYLGSPEKPEMNSVLNFSLFNAIERVFQQMQPTSIMSYRLESINRYFPHPELLLNFIDNHDGARYLTRGSHSSFRQALLFIMTIPGIPVIYYGTEQELLGTRQTMFKGGAGSPDKDHFNVDSESFRFLQELISLRKENEMFRRGDMKVLMDETGGPGVFVYRLSYMDRSAIIVLNTSDSEKYVDNIHTGAEPGIVLSTLYSLKDGPDQWIVDYQGNLSFQIPPGQGIVMAPGTERIETESSPGSISIDPWKVEELSDEVITVGGDSKGVDKIGLMINGDIRHMVEVEVNPEGRWSTELTTRHLVNGKHRLTAISMDHGLEEASFSDYVEFKLNIPAILCAEYQDETGDDQGPSGLYHYPSDISYDKQMDIEALRIFRSGNNLQVEITMAQLTRIWIPPNGFDHVLLNLFIDLPGLEGVRELPLLNAEMPGGKSWDYLVSVAGFGNAVFSSEGASPSQTGRISGPAAMVSTDAQDRTITLTIASEALGYPVDLDGTIFYLTSWDGGPGSPKELKPQSQLWSFSGGSVDDPKIMDDTELIILNSP